MGFWGVEEGEETGCEMGDADEGGRAEGGRLDGVVEGWEGGVGPFRLWWGVGGWRGEKKRGQ